MTEGAGRREARSYVTESGALGSRWGIADLWEGMHLGRALNAGGRKGVDARKMQGALRYGSLCVRGGAARGARALVYQPQPLP